MVYPRNELSDGKVRLRPFEAEDLEEYRRWVNDPEIMSLVDRYRPVTRSEHARWHREMVSREDRIVFAVERVSDGAFAGNVWLHDVDRHHRRAEVRIVLGRHLGQGLGQAALSLLRKYAFRRVHLEKLFAWVLATNPRAVRAFTRAGFVREATLKADRRVKGKRVDVHILSSWAR